MADNNDKITGNPENGQQNQPAFDVLRVYAKDCSLETPNSPAIFGMPLKPQISIEFGANSTAISNEEFEVDLRITVTCKSEGKVAYIAEVHQAGIFLVRVADKNSANYFISGVAPNILYPYACEHISDMVTRATFPQLCLRPMNFEAAFRLNQLKAAEEAQSKKEADKKEDGAQQ